MEPSPGTDGGRSPVRQHPVVEFGRPALETDGLDEGSPYVVALRAAGESDE